MKKNEIFPDDIKANIYDYVELIVDFHGLTRKDVEEAAEKLKKILSPENYSMAETEFGEDELNDYISRKGLSETTKRHYREHEMLIRFCSKDEMVCISISRFFISINLFYGEGAFHDIKANIAMLEDIVSLFAEQPYFEVETVYLIKANSIYCVNLDYVFECFDMIHFADTSYIVQRSLERNVYTGYTEVYNNFEVDDCEIELTKTVVNGMLPDSDEESYEAKLNIVTSYEPMSGTIHVADIFSKLSKISFEIFLMHITERFADELVKGYSELVVEGVNYYG